MRPNALTELISAGHSAISAWMSIDSGYLAEILSHAGYDAVVVDLQHGMFGVDTAVRLLQAVSAGPAMPMARCPSHDPAMIGKLLDAGAYGIICPGVDTAQQAADFVMACRYPPVGARSFGPSRGLLYGGPDYVTNADDTVLTWAMIESVTALQNLDAIVATPGLDGVYVGPNDLALSLGEPGGQAVVPQPVLDALARVATTARAAGKWAGCFCADARVALNMIELGYHLVTPGNDAAVMRAAAAQRISAIRGVTSTSTSATLAVQGGY